jgi:hypothetical protein
MHHPSKQGQLPVESSKHPCAMREIDALLHLKLCSLLPCRFSRPNSETSPLSGRKQGANSVHFASTSVRTVDNRVSTFR